MSGQRTVSGTKDVGIFSQMALEGRAEKLRSWLHASLMPSDVAAVFSKPMSQSDLQFTKGSLRVKQTISYIKQTGHLGEHYRNSDS